MSYPAIPKAPIELESRASRYVIAGKLPVDEEGRENVRDDRPQGSFEAAWCFAH